MASQVCVLLCRGPGGARLPAVRGIGSGLLTDGERERELRRLHAWWGPGALELVCNLGRHEAVVGAGREKRIDRGGVGDDSCETQLSIAAAGHLSTSTAKVCAIN